MTGITPEIARGKKAPDMFGLSTEVEITGDGHKLRVGEFHGMARMVDALEKIHESKRTPGFAYALAIAEREMADARSKLMADNLRAAAAAGWDINQVQRIDLRGFTLIVEPTSPSEEG